MISYTNKNVLIIEINNYQADNYIICRKMHILITRFTFTGVYFTSQNIVSGDPSMVAVEHGGLLTLGCQSSASQSFVIKWRNSTHSYIILVNNATGHYVTSEYQSRAAHSVQNGITLVAIAQVTCSDDGEYVCEATMADNSVVTGGPLALYVYGK